MELLPTLISAGWACGVNAWATVLVLGLAGRAGFGEEIVPEELTRDPVLVTAGVLYAIEFVADKVPLFDNLWDLGSTLVRPAVGSALGVELAGAEELSGLDRALSGGASGTIALVSHAVKASLRLGINTSPEPVSNVLASLAEDGLVIAVTAFSLEHPELAAIAALALLAGGVALVVFLWRRVRAAGAALRARIRGRSP